MRKIIVLSVFTYIISVNPHKEVIKSKNPLPYFRRKVEEIADDIPIERVTEDTRGKLLSLLVQNVKEIFNDITDEAEEIEYTTAVVSTSKALKPTRLKTLKPTRLKTLKPTRLKFDTDDLVNIERTTAMLKFDTDDLVNIERTTTMLKFDTDDLVNIERTTTMLEIDTDDLVNIDRKTTMLNFRADDLVTVKHTNDVMLYENLSVTTLDRELDELYTIVQTHTTEITETTTLPKLKEIVKEMKSFEKSDAMTEEVTPLLTSISSYVLEPTDMVTLDEINKTCVYCNNIITENCYDPRNKIVPSVMCKRESDLCYSMHTPFGIVDRGCFNINYDLTTYVCSCNLCNYISISEMPYIFSNMQDWVDNVIELSRTRSFRKSVFKDMSCLRCEVHTTNKTGDIVDTANCLEGNIATLPFQDCKDDEICGVKAVRSDGYIWRGCLKAPLYNYWWALCDHDLCNHDSLVSIYNYTIL